MKPRCIHPFYRYNEYTIATLSFVANGMLALLVLLRSPSEIRKYSRVLLCSCFVEVLFAATCLVVEEHLSFRGGILFMVVVGSDMQSYDGNFAVVMAQIYMIYATLAMGAVPLIYRYATIVHKHVMTWLQLFPFVTVALLLPSPIILAAYAVWYENGMGIIRTMNVTMSNMDCEDSGDVPLFTADQISSKPATCIPLLCGIMNVTVTYSAIIFCTVRIWKAVRQGIFSARVKALQGQLNSALAIQALNPLLVMALPLAFALGAMLTRSERLSFALPAVTAVTAWIPLVNPLSTIYFIRSYRLTIMRMLCRPCIRKREGRTSQATTMITGGSIAPSDVHDPWPQRFDVDNFTSS